MLKNAFFVEPPDLGQLAFDGEWEKAVAFPPGRFLEEHEAASYVGEAREVAFEAFFNTAFFGIRRMGTPQTLSRFIVASAQALSSSSSGDEFFTAISDSQNLSLARKFSTAEIGAVNAWRSIGSFEILDPIESLSSFDDLWQTLQQTPVIKNATHPKAIEFAFDNGDGTTHWFAIPLSSNIPPFLIEPEKLREALQCYRDWVNRR